LKQYVDNNAALSAYVGDAAFGVHMYVPALPHTWRTCAQAVCIADRRKLANTYMVGSHDSGVLVPEPIPAAVLKLPEVPDLEKLVAKVKNMSQTQTQRIFK
jgi:hypothetical protein